MTDEHQDHGHGDQGQDVTASDGRSSGSAPTTDYGAPWLPITAPVDRS
ncbi:hypothetical protein AB0F39_34605 [Streptomyces murinus]